MRLCFFSADANKYLDGAAITLDDASGLTKDGYVFTGWKFKGVTYNGSYTVNNVLRDEEIVFEAVWELDWQPVRDGLTAGNFYTICNSATMIAVRGVSLWSFASKDANFAYLISEDAPYAAGKPYIVLAEADEMEAAMLSDNEPAGVNGALHGTLSLMDQAALNAAGDNIYLVIGNELRRVDGQTSNTLPANRAYVDLDEIPNVGEPVPAPGKKVRKMPMQNQTTTGCELIHAAEAPAKMMINGQLYILRGEKKFDVTGRQVK